MITPGNEDQSGMNKYNIITHEEMKTKSGMNKYNNKHTQGDEDQSGMNKYTYIITQIYMYR